MSNCGLKMLAFTVVAGALVLTGCGAKHKDPTRGYKGYDSAITSDQYVPSPEPEPVPEPEKPVPPRDQKIDQCATVISTEPVFEVIEGGTFTQEVKMEGPQGGLVLRGAPSDMNIKTVNGKHMLTYTVRRGTVPTGKETLSFN